MDNKETTQDFSLEDIMREFGTESQEPEAQAPAEESVTDLAEAPAPEEPAPEEPEDVSEPLEEAPCEEDTSGEAAEPAQSSGDTIRLDDLTEAVERARQQIAETTAAAEATTIFKAIAGEEAPGEDDTDEEDYGGEEDYDEDGEEYDEEEDDEEEEDTDGHGYELNGDQIPAPRPIPFRSRLGDLKRKLVAGPEKRYYDLSEIGLGRVQAAIFVSVLIVLLCAGATALYAMGAVMENRLRLMIFSQILAMMVSALLGCYVLLDGIVDLFTGKFSLNSMLFLTLAACAADAVFCLQELRVPCCAAFCLEMTMALWNRSLRRSTEMGQMDTLRKATRLDSLVKSPDYFEGRPGILRGEGQVEDFMDHYNLPTGPEKVQNIFAILSVLVCIGIAVLAGIRHGLSLAIQVLSTSMLVAVPASFFVSLSRPAAILQRRLHMVGTVICGWQGVKKLCGKASYPLTDRDLFPQGSTKLNGVKFFGDREPEDVIAYAAALIHANGGGLESVFTQLLKSRNGAAYPVFDLKIHDRGVSGCIAGEDTLVGTLDFLKEQGIQIPEGTMVTPAVYCAIDGQLSAVFAINYSRTKAAAGGLVTLCGYKKIHPVLLSTDFILDESLLKEKFGVKTNRMSFPTREIRDELAQVKPDPELTAAALTTHENLSASAYAVTGSRTLRTASRFGLAIHMTAGIVGMLIMAALAYIGSVELLTPFNVLLYQLVWMFPGLLITEWARTV